MSWIRKDRLLPGMFLIGLLAFQPLSLKAQRDVREAVNIPEPQPPVTAPALQPTPEQIGDSNLVRQHYQQAIAAYKQAPADSAPVWNKMGIAYEMMFDLKDAERCFKKSLHLDRHNAKVMNNLGTVYDSMKKYRAAEHMYRRAIKADPKSAIFYKNLGTNLLTRRKYEKGWQAYQHALALNPQIFGRHDVSTVQNPTSLQERGAMNYYMAKTCMLAGQTDLALRYLRQAMDEGFISARKAAADSSFKRLRKDPRFELLLTEHTKQ